MISSEPTLDSHDSFKKDLPDHLLSRIIPLFGFEYQPVTEPCIYSHISKSKSPKGISLISKHPFNKKQLNLQNCNYIKNTCTLAKLQISFVVHRLLTLARAQYHLGKR